MLTSSLLPPPKISAWEPHTTSLWAPQRINNPHFASDRPGRRLTYAGSCCSPEGTFGSINLLKAFPRMIVPLSDLSSCPLEPPRRPLSLILTSLLVCNLPLCSRLYTNITYVVNTFHATRYQTHVMSRYAHPSLHAKTPRSRGLGK